MTKKAFRAESKRLLDLMINSIYTHREIFLRELISNSSDAIDKIYYRALTDESLKFDKDSYFIKIIPDKSNRTLKLIDTGIGMTKEELEENLGIIAKSGSLAFKSENELKDGYDIIGQFGVGFYSAFMVADKVTVISKSPDSDKAWKWESEGAEGYMIEEAEKTDPGTEILLHIKENTEEENFDDYLEEYRLRSIVKKYSDFIRYPIKMDVYTSKKKEDSDEYDTIVEEQTINSMVPIWRKNKSDLSQEDYDNFYSEKHYGFDKPLKHIHFTVDGAISYRALLFIPETKPFDYYTKEYEKGLELYSSGVMIMNKCPDLVPDYFGFVKGLVDSEDLSLNISREILQHDRQLKLIAKNIKNKIKSELLSLLENDREKYESFYESFGRQLKFGVYSDFGTNKEELKDLMMFKSSKEKKYATLKEYVERMPEDQKFIYYASGDSIDKIDKSPQIEAVLDKGYEFLYFTEEIDEFAINVLMSYSDKEFRSVAGKDTGIEPADKALDEKVKEESADLLNDMKELLKDKVSDVKLSTKLRKHPVCLSSEGELTIEMEKVLNTMPDGGGVKAQKVLEINPDHKIYKSLMEALASDKEKLSLYTDILYNQALLIEGLPIEDPVDFADKVSKLMG
ncbi:molecular chaperone HtpG [Alkalibacter saccharofermentans]|uniref:Chaperone protein HtpG n=1 Tax=Alkalibacter saccharofermentans DSM 14828 TaxID=1120975 RepID=A0A1M4WWE3_9FIRM|nr:molecular chaperone HtpG [Alkalibacter saccharofermentans]SHE85546.1 molecular chaperone HtpG [Alkalibacter saccharofermentans DSM 14828]